MKKFNHEELEMIAAIRDINNDQTIDAYEALGAYEEMIDTYEETTGDYSLFNF